MLRLVVASLVLCLAALATPTSAAEPHGVIKARVNQGTVGIVSGSIAGTYIRIASDLAAVLDDGDRLRVLPVMGKGSVQNITDILYLRGIDAGIVQSDVLGFLKRQGVHRNIDERIHYITKLYNEEFHLIARDEIRSVAELAGRKVNLGVKGSGTFMTGSTVFSILNVAIEPTTYDQALALEKLKSGEIAAMAYVSGKPASLAAGIKPEDGLRLIPIPYETELRDSYLPSAFSDRDYPGLVPPGGRVETVAVGAVLAAFNWEPDSERYAKVARFVEAFFSKFDAFLKSPRHPKWREVNLMAELPGWTRFKAAREWLERRVQADEERLKPAFARFLEGKADAEDLGGAEIDRLFEKFIAWRLRQAQ